MDWVELAVETTSLGAEVVSALLIDAGALGTQIIDRADLPGQEALDAAWALMDDSVKNQMPVRPVVKAWFQDRAQAKRAREAIAAFYPPAGFDAGSLAISQGAVEDETWAESWKKHFHPIKVGCFVIRPTWEAYQAKPGDLVIDMDPGMAFGTGWHETTRLCLGLIEKHYQGGRALDLGTGSGILALALGKLGARDVLAVDIDPGAVRAAGENIAQNGLSNVIEVRQGDLARGVSGPFAFASANILADAIIALAGPLKPVMAPGAVFVASGIVKDRAGDVKDALRKDGWQLLDQALEGEWAALAFEA